ncbi:MAG: DUF4912 domain-containing protein [Clostridia bacterium]|nr:DUF4912 domain-containing protein [Clostridia bacterium]
MPRTTKDVAKSVAKKENEVAEVKKVTKKSTKKIDDTASTKSKKVTAKKEPTITKKTATTKAKTSSTSSSKKSTTTKARVSATSSSTKSTATKKKVSTTSSKKSTSTKKKIEILEYYDLPYRYNQTTVKVLAQTPEMLFVYWDISDEDRLAYTTKYGEDFFSKTRPVLLVHNTTMNYTFEIEINDFANSWYLHINDANCEYVIELGRRPNLYQDTVKDPYIYVASSNEMEAPNDHILFEHFQPHVAYRNVKTGQIIMKDFSHLADFKNMQEIYGIYDLYKQIYKNELFDEIVDGNLINPSSLSSSSFK